MKKTPEGTRYPDKSIVIGDVILTRADFGPGEAGQKSYEYILKKGLCSAIIDGEKCKKRAIETIVFNEMGLEVMGSCGEDHRLEIQKGVQLYLPHKAVNFSINGFNKA